MKTSCPRNHKDVQRNAHGDCKECNRERARVWRVENKERDRSNAKRWAKANPDMVRDVRLKAYGLDLDDWDDMVEEQHGHCPLCGSDSNLCVDHDHESGMVRGLLCGSCNQALGLMADDPARLQRAIQYLNDAKRILDGS